MSTPVKSAVFLGSKSLGLNILKCLVRETYGIKWTIIHPNDSADPRNTLNDFNEYARQLDIDILVANSSQAAKAMLSDIAPDIGFVCGWYWLLDGETISYVDKGLWGIHNSLLPKYRGGSPLVWSILNGDDQVGSTVFKISEGMDDGDVLLQVSVSLEKSQDISDALFAIEGELIRQLPSKWRDLVAGKAALTSQDGTGATYCGLRSEEDGLIDWSMTAGKIHDFVRAQATPYPCAYTYLGDKKIRILRTTIFDGVFYGTPGQVLQRGKNSVTISCGENTALELKNIRLDGQNGESSPSQIITSIKDRLKSYSIPNS